jgi:hypothetical protein
MDELIEIAEKYAKLFKSKKIIIKEKKWKLN